MSVPRIIGITGEARHGKDTVAKVLVKELGYTKAALADQMKEAMLRINPIVRTFSFPKHAERLATVVKLQGWEKAKENPEVRALLQRFGTTLREIAGEDVWIGALAKSVQGFYGSERRVVIPDVRFLNEAEFIRRNHGEVWRVVRPGFDNGLTAEARAHKSELEMASIRPDETFTNDQDEGYLQGQVYRYLQARRTYPEFTATPADKRVVERIG